MVNVKKVAIFVGGMLFGSAGFKILASNHADQQLGHEMRVVMLEAPALHLGVHPFSHMFA